MSNPSPQAPLPRFSHRAYPELAKPAEWMGIHFKVAQGAGVMGYLLWMGFESLPVALAGGLALGAWLHLALQRDPQFFILRLRATRLPRGGNVFHRPSGTALVRIRFQA